MQLFLVPHAGGSKLSYRDWPSHFAGHSVVAIPCNINGDSEPYLRDPEEVSIQQMGKTLALSIDSRRKFALFGHSMGALVAFEATQYLRKNNLPQPQFIVVSGHRAPHQPLVRERLHELPDLEFDKKVAQYKATNTEIIEDSDVMAFFRPYLRRDFKSCETYNYLETPPLDCPLLCIGGYDDPDVSADDLHKWSHHTSKFLGVHIANGGHFYLFDSIPEVVNLLTTIMKSLNIYSLNSTQ